MNQKLLIPCSVIAATFPLTVPTTVELAPEPGLALAKTFTTTLELESGDLSSTMGGAEVPPAYLPDILVVIENTIEVEVEDTYLAVEAGASARLRRTFGKLDGHGFFEMEMQGAPPEAEEWERSVSELVDETVELDWDLEGDSCTTKLVDAEETDEVAELLSRLDPDLDLLAFLPEDEVEVGDRWRVEVEAITALLQPGGRLGLEDEGERDGGVFEEVSCDGKISARFTAIEEEQGAKLAVIEIEGTYVRVQQRPTDLEHIPVVDGTATETATTTLELEGQLRWNLRGKHASSLELEGEVEYVSHTVRDEGQPGPTFTSTLPFHGTRVIQVEFQSAGE